MIEIGEAFPDFKLKDQNREIVEKKDLAGNAAVIYFYPKDDTSGCTTEACEFRDAFPRFKGIRVIGVSPDSPQSHAKFAAKYDLPFTLLSDEEKQLLIAVGVWVEKAMYGKKYMGVERTTILLDDQGKVVKVWNKVKPAGHAEEVEEAIRSM